MVFAVRTIGWTRRHHRRKAWSEMLESNSE